MNIYETAERFKQAKLDLNLMIDAGLIDEESLNDTLESLNYDFDEKAIDLAKYIKEIQLNIEGIKSEILNMQERKSLFERKLEKLSEYLVFNMKDLNKEKIKGIGFDVKIQKNPPKLVLDESMIGDEWWQKETVRSLKKKEIKEACKQRNIPGAKLIQSERLVIK